MSNSVPQQQFRADAARSDAASARRADTPLPDFQASSPIELEIARSERASAALAATRALARAAFTDSQLAAEEAAIDARFRIARMESASISSKAMLSVLGRRSLR